MDRLSDEQFERLKSELEGQHSGASRAGRPMVLEGGLDWKAMSLSPADMDFIAARREAAREIALAFGVPPMLLGIPDVSSEEAVMAFGDFKRGYLIVDRQGVRVLRDPYSAKPFVLFYTTKRVGGGVQDFNAIKLLKTSAA